MIGKTSIKEAMNIDIAISQPMMTALDTWSRMYNNDADWLTAYIKSLNLPAAIASELARLATIELQVKIEGSARADWLAKQFEKVLNNLPDQIEYGAAKGGLILKPYPDRKNLNVDYVQADQFCPVKIDANKMITSCVFVDQRTIGSNYFTRLEYHDLTNAGLNITNKAYKSSAKDTLGSVISLDAIDDWAGLQEQATITGVIAPLYGYFKMPLANNIDPTSSLGVSGYARAVDLIKQADTIWSDLIWEFESGRRAIYVDPLAFGRDANNKPLLPDKRLFRSIDFGGAKAIGEGSAEDMFHDWTPEFREAAIKSGLNTILQRIEFNCGLAYGTLSDPQSVDKTATEIKSSKQRTYATVTAMQKSVKTALDQLIYAMDVWATLANLAPRGTYTTTYNFDDSVINDREVQMSEDRQTVGLGAMSKVTFLMRNYGLDEVTAKKWVAEAQAEQPEDLFAGA